MQTANKKAAHCIFERVLSFSGLTPQERVSTLLNHAYTALITAQPGAAYRDLRIIDDLLGTGITLDQPERAAYLERQKEACAALDIDSLTERSLAAPDNRDYPSEAPYDGENWGVYATRDIAPGETVRGSGYNLVVVEPPEEARWQYWFKPDRDQQTRTTMQVLAICRAVHELIDDPRKALAWGDLYPRIKSRSRSDHSVSDTLCEQASISLRAISDKISKNSRMTRSDMTGSEKTDAFGRLPAWIYVDPVDAKTNHSCIPNIATVDSDDGMVSLSNHPSKSQSNPLARNHICRPDAVDSS